MAFSLLKVDCVVCTKPIDHTPKPDPLPECPHCHATLTWRTGYDADGNMTYTLLGGRLGTP